MGGQAFFSLHMLMFPGLDLPQDLGHLAGRRRRGVRYLSCFIGTLSMGTQDSSFSC